ncbi:MAG TPA: FtsX-like permease family protein [Bacteroidota bacterium]
MTARDLLAISAGNLWRMKLRTGLTIAGIVIAIAAFVSMVSFGAGTKENIDRQFRELGLLTTIQVYPQRRPNEPEGLNAALNSARLDAAATERIGKIPGVLLVYPYDLFSVKLRLGDSLIDARAQALSRAALQTKLFSRLRAGKIFDADTSRQVVLSANLLKRLGTTFPDSLVGLHCIVSVQVSTIDSAFGHVLADGGVTALDRLRRIHVDSLLFNLAYRSRVIRAEANEAVRRFVAGFLNARRTVSDTLTVSGVMETEQVGRVRMEPVIIPFRTGERFTRSGMSGNPTDLFAAMSSGNLFSSADDPSGKTFSQLTVNFDPHVLYTSVKDSIEAMGYRTFSFAEAFEEIQKTFVYFNTALGLVGLLALVTASLGIVNTMVMSILERKREIGIFKSLGADDREIRALFLAESGAMGFIGSSIGILFGWVITRIVSVVAHIYMRREGIPELELFALPLWLILIALAIGIGVAVVAGLYPASRAARIDPVEALRND